MFNPYNQPLYLVPALDEVRECFSDHFHNSVSSNKQGLLMIHITCVIQWATREGRGEGCSLKSAHGATG